MLYILRCLSALLIMTCLDVEGVECCYDPCSLSSEIKAEYLCMWRKERSAPPLLTKNLVAGTAALDQPETKVIFGRKKFDDSPQSGVRGEYDLWYDSCIAFGVGGFWVNDSSKHVSIESDQQGHPAIGIPFFDTYTNREGTLSVASNTENAGVFVGEAKAQTNNKVWGAEAFAKWRCLDDCDFRLDLIAGYQYFNINDSLSLKTSSVRESPSLSTQIDNRFSADNSFNGAMVGFAANYYWDCWAFSLAAKVGLGEMRSKVKIRGGSVTSPSQFSLNYGFVESTNRGSYTKSQFEAIPQLDLQLRYSVFDCLSISMGYVLIYWPDVYLAGAQIDRKVNLFQDNVYPRQFKKKCEFWLQGLNAGINFQF